MATVELTGLAMIPIMALGATLAAAAAKSRTMEALVWMNCQEGSARGHSVIKCRTHVE